MVAGESLGRFVYNSNTGTTTYETPPPDNGSVSYYSAEIFSVNDLGQALFAVDAYDSYTGTDTYELWAWQAKTNTWTRVPMDSLLPAGAGIASGVINNNGQVAGVASSLIRLPP